MVGENPLRLKFSPGKDNTKLAKLEKLMKRKLYTFSLPSGVSCPYADECLAKVVRNSEGRSKMWYGPDMKYVCYSATLESIYPEMLRQREHNIKILEVAGSNIREAADIILDSIPANCQVIRLHVGGDFKTRPYFRAWCLALLDRPDILGYAYTKSLPFWVLE